CARHNYYGSGAWFAYW
nr:immunoglobulin heavy chain junction region [Mus musculus]